MPKIKHQKRERVIKIRVNESEYQQLLERKNTAELATWIRKTCLGAAPIATTRADPELVRAMGRIGTNLNQIARHANTDKSLDSQVLQGIQQIELYIKHIIMSNKNAS